MEIIKLAFKKNGYKVDLTDSRNLELIRKYVVPVISNNPDWGTPHFTMEHFDKNPLEFQIIIDSTIVDNVHVAIESGQPIAIFEYNRFSFDQNPYNRIKYLKKHVIDNMSDRIVKKIQQTTKLTIEEINKLMPETRELLLTRPLYEGIGVVVHPDYQNKSTGVAEQFYKLITDGFAFGWTSNPIIVRKRRKLYDNTLFYPLLGETIVTAGQLAAHLHIISDMAFYKLSRYSGKDFGVINSQYSVERDVETRALSKSMLEAEKISEIDNKRINYSLDFHMTAGAIISWNN